MKEISINLTKSFSHIFRGIDYLSDIFGQEDHEIPADWLRALAEANLTPEEMAEIESLRRLR